MFSLASLKLIFLDRFVSASEYLECSVSNRKLFLYYINNMYVIMNPRDYDVIHDASTVFVHSRC